MSVILEGGGLLQGIQCLKLMFGSGVSTLVKERSDGAVYELETGSVIGLVPSGSVFALGLSVLHFLQNHLERD